MPLSLPTYIFGSFAIHRVVEQGTIGHPIQILLML